MTPEPDELDEPGALRPGTDDAPGRRWGKLLPLVIAVVVLAGFVAMLLAVTISRGGGARESATEFMVNVREVDYDEARELLCDGLRSAYPDGAALRTGLGFDGSLVTAFNVGEAVLVDDGESLVPVSLELGGGIRTTLSLTVVEDGGRYLICGF